MVEDQGISMGLIFGNILHIDLTTRKIKGWRENEEVFRHFIGGSGYGAVSPMPESP